jgi:hypothetical protein
VRNEKFFDEIHGNKIDVMIFEIGLSVRYNLTAQPVFRDGEYVATRGFTPCLRRRRARFGFLHDALLILSKISRRGHGLVRIFLQETNFHRVMVRKRRSHLNSHAKLTLLCKHDEVSKRGDWDNPVAHGFVGGHGR